MFVWTLRALALAVSIVAQPAIAHPDLGKALYLQMTTAADEMIPAAPAPSGGPFLSGLIMPPGDYALYPDRAVTLPEGLLHILEPGVSGGHRLIAANPAEPYALMRAIARLTVYGDNDEGLPLHPGSSSNPNTALWQMRFRKLAMRCGPTVALARYIAGLQGVETRTVRLLTADAPNNWDDGHVALEAKVDGGWRHFDVSADVYFRRDGAHLSLREMFDGGYDEVVKLAPYEADSVEAGGNWQFHPGKYFDIFSATPEQRAAWRARIYGIPGIDRGGLTYFYLPPGTEDREAWVRGLDPSYRVVSREQWSAMFYAD